MVEKGNGLSLSTSAAHPHMVIGATIKAAAARAEDAAASVLIYPRWKVLTRRQITDVMQHLGCILLLFLIGVVQES